MAAEWTSCPAAPSDTGAFRLGWKGPDGATFRLERIDDSGGPSLIYQGPQTGTTITGAREGTLAYRVGMVSTEGRVASWSQPCTVQVRPPEMWLALALFALGATVTLATAGAIVRGHRAHRAGELQ